MCVKLLEELFRLDFVVAGEVAVGWRVEWSGVAREEGNGVDVDDDGSMV